MVYEYATKSEIIHRDNLAPLAKPVPDGLWPIGIDYGFSGVKGFAPNKVFCYPNCAVKLTENEFNSMLDSSDTDIFIRDNEGTWVVGERASKVITAENSMNYEAEMYGRNRYFSPVFKALMKVGLGIEVASNGIRSYNGSVEEARARYGSNITIPEMQNALRRGYITSFDRRTMSSKNIPFDDIIHKHTDAVCDEAIQKMLSIYNYLQNHNYLIVTGGTGNAWWNRISDYLKNMESLKILSGNRCDPSLSNTYSNVRGYFQYIVALASRRG